MTLALKNRSLLAIGALALGAVVTGCSSAVDTPNGFVPDNSGSGGGSSADGGNDSGQANGGSSGSSGASSSGGSGSPSGTGGSSGSGSGSSSGASGSSGSGSSSGGSSGGGSDAGNPGDQDANAGGPDATTGQDAGSTKDTGANPDAGLPPNDAGGLCADQAAWLAPMNAARAAVNAGEPPLVCDPIAVQVALNYAKTCVFLVHNANRSAQYVALGGTGGLGENIAVGAPTESIANAVASWINEGANYNHATNTCAAGQVCGHYTQVVWKNTTRVGCAKVSCTTNSPFGAMWDNSVCDYAPPGNVGTQSPY